MVPCSHFSFPARPPSSSVLQNTKSRLYDATQVLTSWEKLCGISVLFGGTTIGMALFTVLPPAGIIVIVVSVGVCVCECIIKSPSCLH